MDTDRFDALTRAVSTLLSRRTLVGVLGGEALAVCGVLDATSRKRKKRKSIKRNNFGCVNVGAFCKTSGQCCSGICNGKKGKKRCQAHDTGGCQDGQDNCEGIPIRCVNGTSDGGLCLRTTGDAGYCFGIIDASACIACRQDADCVQFCGPRAACVVCSPCEAEVGSPTACVGPVEVSCVFT